MRTVWILFIYLLFRWHLQIQNVSHLSWQHASKAAKSDGPVSEWRKRINNCTCCNHTSFWLWWNEAEGGTGRGAGLVLGQDTFPAKPKGMGMPQQVDPALGYRQQGELRGRESRSCLSRAQGDWFWTRREQALTSGSWDWSRSIPGMLLPFSPQPCARPCCSCESPGEHRELLWGSQGLRHLLLLLPGVGVSLLLSEPRSKHRRCNPLVFTLRCLLIPIYSTV